MSKSDVVNKVVRQVFNYWYMGGFDTVKMYNVVKDITKEVDKYELLQKARSKTSEAMVEKREQFQEDIKKLLVWWTLIRMIWLTSALIVLHFKYLLFTK